MNMPDGGALAQIEKLLRVSPGTFVENKYFSIFDIISQSRQEFISANLSWLGNRGNKVYDLALGQAEYIRRLFRKNKTTSHVKNTLQATQSGATIKNNTCRLNEQGLMQNGPTWQNQFGEDWKTYCQSGAPEAYDSPVSYLSWLYQQALIYEQEMVSAGGDIIPLSERRPDLAMMTIDNDAVNQVVPTLQLVNEIFEESLSTAIPQGGTMDRTLATTRYPTLLPYHFPHDQVMLALQNAQVPLETIVSQTDSGWPWFLSDTLTGARSVQAAELASKLAPEQMVIVTEADNSAAGDMSGFYKADLGLDTEDYSPFADVLTFAEQLTITASQQEYLLARGPGGTTVVTSENFLPSGGNQRSSDSDVYGARFINQGAGEGVVGLVFNDESSPERDMIGGTDLVISDAGVKGTDGRFSTAISVDATQGAEVFLPYDMSYDGTEVVDFTLSFWFRVHSDIKDSATVVMNKTGTYSGNATGIALLTSLSEHDVSLELSVYGGELYSKMTETIPVDTWVFFSIVHDTTSKHLTGYYCTDNVNLKSLIVDYSKASASIELEDTTWGFNGNKGNTHYMHYPEQESVIDFDDICVWNRQLNEQEINMLLTSPGGGNTSMEHYYPCDTSVAGATITHLSDARMDRINRMVRLCRWLGISFEETDLLVCACINAQGKDNVDFTMNEHTLRMLGVFRHWQQQYAVTPFQFAAVLSQITPYAISPAVPFLDQIFNSPSLFDEPFAITGATVAYTDVSGDSARSVRQLCAGLGISEAEFRVLADMVAAQQGDATARTFPLTLDVVSALYRMTMVPRWLGLSFAEGVALMSLLPGVEVCLAGVPQLAFDDAGKPTSGDILDALMALDSARDWAKTHALSWIKNYLILQPTPAHLAASSEAVNFVNGIKQQLPATLLSEQSFATLPMPDQNDGWTWMNTLGNVVDAAGLVLAVAADYTTLLTMVQADIAGLPFAANVDMARLADSLATIIWQAKQAQYGVADSALAQLFNTRQSLSAFLLQWENDTEYRLLVDTLAINSGYSVSDPTTITWDYLSHLYQLGLRAGTVAQFQLTPATLSVFLEHPDWFGVTDTSLTLALLQRFSRYLDWLGLAGKEDAVLAYLNWVNAVTPPQASSAAQALGALLAWDSSEVELATARFTDGIAKRVNEVDYVMRLQSLATDTGLSVTPLLNTGALVVGSVNDTWDAWQSAGESLVAAQTLVSA
ncbi:28.1 kDa virulence protein [Klebsiella oxytoca]|nr:hypothetical protein CIG58_14285 [Klebsiella oxytoca]CAF2003319.1 28.1 kDa virulence protein [Klebsiella oxytoca]CAH5248274.1 28.1 kDa virulence protein [Klebsiella oxytoca]